MSYVQAWRVHEKELLSALRCIQSCLTL